MNLSHLISVSLFCICAINADNHTESTTLAPDASTTQMYTTLPALIATDDPLDSMDDNECLFEWVATLEDAEDIDVTLCGYMDNGVQMIGMSLQIPPFRWFSVGFISDSAYDSSNAIKDLYSIVIQPSTFSRTVQEYFGNLLLESTTTIISDDNIAGYRYIKIIRKVTVGINDLSTTLGLTNWDKYFDFAQFKDCDDSMKVVSAFGKNDNEQVAFDTYSDDTDTAEAMVDAVGGISCDDLEDESKGFRESMMGCLLVSMVGMLFLS